MANGRPWTEENSKTLRTLAEMGLDDGMIAKQMGYCVDTIQRRRSALGIQPYYRIQYGGWLELRRKYGYEDGIHKP